MRRELDILETELTDEEIYRYANSTEDIYMDEEEESLFDLLGYEVEREE